MPGDLKSYYNLFEGGNIFKGADKQPVTTRIPKDNIAPSLAFVEKILGFKLDQWLGTTGKKETSGDMDVSVDAAKHDKKEVALKLKAWAKEQGQAPGEWVKLSGDNVHFKTPIRDAQGNETGAYAQLDLMFGNPQFQSWSMRGESGEYKGMHRHIIMASIAKAQGMKWSYKAGLVDRATNAPISQDPKEIVRKLLPGYSGNPMELSVTSILSYVYKKYKGQQDKIEALIGEAVATLAEHYGVQLPMPEDTTVHESNDPDEYFLARLRTRIVDMDMEPLVEKSADFYKAFVMEGKLRDMNHLEDLVLDEGPSGLYKAIKILRAFAEGSAHNDTTIKWDGSPAIVFGRDENGQFVLTDKSGFAAKGYDGKSTSAKELQSMLTNRSPSMDQSRQQFIGNMGNVFAEYERATPKDFRGFLSGDLMYFNTPPVENESYAFQPNVVRYAVHKNSKLGSAIGNSKSGITVHKYIGDQFNSTEEAIKTLGGTEVLVIPPVYVQQPSKINTGPINKLEAFANKHKAEISALFDPAGLKGIANVHQLFYKYINNSVDTGLENLGKDFAQWLGTENLTDSKRANIAAYLKANKKGVNALWTLIRGTMKLKDWLVDEFDSHPADVQQSIGGEKGGEGYVVKTKDGAVKLVSRHKFTAANRALHR